MADQPSSASITVQAGTPAQPPGPMPDQEINDWDVFYQLLLSSKLNQHGGEFVVIHQGKIVAHGADPEELRKMTAQQLKIGSTNLVVAFVDNQECVTVD
jgi:Family of unknown function (DUF5678)